ncbi:MAG TPA: hypothetical protein VFT95_05800 [Micromonosporaceae bacterium]|nr:hypothetical protein [Micromonosporaceae bacterium]
MAAFGIAFTGPALLVAAVVARLAGLDGTRWSTWAVMTAITLVSTVTAGALSEPLVSRVKAFVDRRLSGSADEHTN